MSLPTQHLNAKPNRLSTSIDKSRLERIGYLFASCYPPLLTCYSQPSLG
ncbi:hypothetical protein THOB06_210048 [Vibrio rotiferianus]|nr:hypothetical protein THOG10_210045 [Vibrio rotiferianus]CAH1575569.1 hypothetical protein THOB06_210048 [Vibrio rotiferianus]